MGYCLGITLYLDLFHLSLPRRLIGKLGGALIIQEPWRDRLIIGLTLIPRGEVGLIFAELGRVSEIFSNEVYFGMVIVIALTTIFPPLVIKWIYQAAGHSLQQSPDPT